MASPFRPRAIASRGPGPGATPGPGPGFVIPYEHCAAFDLTGTPGHILQDVITISPDGVFVATSMGYGFDEERGRPLALTLATGGAALAPRNVTLGDVPASALIDGVRVNTKASSVVFDPGSTVLTNQPLPRTWLRDNLLERVKDVEDISFFFSMLDSATGRELSDEPAHNLASLGTSTGERPFRPLPRPLAFAPRSTLRVQVIENSDRVTGTLHVVFFGYKLLGLTACPEPLLRSLSASPPPAQPIEMTAGSEVIPFDYVMTFPLSGRPGNRVASEIAINVEGGFIADTIGYGLVPATQGVPLLEAARQAGGLITGGQIDLNDIPLGLFPAGALAEGVRVRPPMVPLAFRGGGLLATIPTTLLDDVFERLNRPEDVRFLYSFNDAGLGRDLQNRPIHNIAGLGIANGDRPFKRLAQPLTFVPRSTLRAEIEERFGRGTLFMTFQGYKLLGASRTASAR